MVCVVELAAFCGATLLVCVALAGADELCCWVCSCGLCCRAGERFV